MPGLATVVGLGLHPVKSTAIRPVGSAEVAPYGLVGDRRWMVVDADHVLVSAREHRELFRIVADTPQTDPTLTVPLRLSAPGLPSIEVAEPQSAAVDLQLFGNELTGRPADDLTNAWLRDAAGRSDLTLVWCDDPQRRTLNPAYSEPGDHTGFADGYPVTLASLSSLQQLNDWILQGALERGEEPPAPLPIERFRANIVIDGTEAFAEDHWTRIRIGGVAFRKAKPVDRCVMTTISAEDLSSTKEPIRTLARHRLFDRKTMFAIHLVPEGTGEIRLGQPVSV
ncbi:MAG: hypothetical protein JWQ74_1794 [Marmoricola sp.]|nr:hypothetical protein [Marmoricola sp.]